MSDCYDCWKSIIYSTDEHLDAEDNALKSITISASHQIFKRWVRQLIFMDYFHSIM